MSRSKSIGLVVLGVLSLLDVAGPLLTDGDNPPMAVAVVGSAIGLASLVCLVYAFRGVRRALQALIGLRVVSALSAVPAFFVDDVETGIQVVVGVFIAVTAIGIALTMSERSPASVMS